MQKSKKSSNKSKSTANIVLQNSQDILELEYKLYLEGVRDHENKSFPEGLSKQDYLKQVIEVRNQSIRVTIPTDNKVLFDSSINKDLKIPVYPILFARTSKAPISVPYLRVNTRVVGGSGDVLHSLHKLTRKKDTTP